MATPQSIIDAILNFFDSPDEQEEFVKAFQAGKGDEFVQDNFRCGTAEFAQGIRDASPYLPTRTAGAFQSSINSGGNAVNVGGQTFNPPPLTAPPAQQLAYYTNVYNQTNTTKIDDRDTNISNQISNIANGPGATAVTAVNQPVASGDGAVAAGGDITGQVATGEGALAAGAGADIIQNAGGENVNVQDANLAGVNFGAGGTATGAAPGGVAVGGDAAVAAPGGTVAQGGGVAAGPGGTVGTAATGGGGVDQSVDASIDLSTTQIAGGDIDQSADATQIAGGDIDQSADVNIAQADNGSVAQAGDQQTDLSDPLA